MGLPIVLVDSGGIAVTESTNGFGTPVEISTNGYGIAATLVASGGLPVIGANVIPNVFNLTTSNTSRLLDGFNARAAGSRDALIGFAGDSLTLGKFTGGDGLTQNLDRQNSAPAQLAALLDSANIPSQYNGIYGTGASVATFNDMDSRAVQTSGTGWAQSPSGSLQTAGGPAWAATAEGTITFTPEVPWDTCIVRYPRRTSGNSPGVWSWQVDDGSATEVDSTIVGTDRTSGSLTIDADLGLHTVSLAWVSGTTTINSIEFYNSAQKSVRVLNMGWSGSTTTNWNNAGYGTAPINEVINLGLDAVILSLGDNDITTSIPLATSRANLEAIIDAWLPTMDVFLMSDPPMATTAADAATQEAFSAMMRSVALAKNIPFLDGIARMGGGNGYEVYNAEPFEWYVDDKHLTETGQGDRAAFVFEVLEEIGLTPYSVQNSEALAVTAAFTTPPTEARKQLIDNLVGELKSAGVWSLLDVLYLPAAADAQAATINWKNPGTFTLSPLNSPTFTADRGFQGNGTTSSVSTQWAANPNGVNFTQNSNSSWFWSLTDSASAKTDIGRTGGTGLYFIRARDTTSGNMLARACDANSSGVAIGTGLGAFGVSRPDSATKRFWHNGQQAGSDVAAASATPSTGVAWICGGNSNAFSDRQQAAAAFGGYLTSAQEAARYNAVLTYLQGIGAV